ncbi:hypothetical protein HL033_01800 [Neoehrlichia mikurensis]|uniref:Uncharacterized protein n=1 Tax=Neoehrlichia mikurensis TaxID=89586 RepID=A0A9Q9BTU5_9RICK|nr:spore germination protein GerPC [Neoehrlichia mikurensis]QXK92270.1 hypothetical protein IAH97_01795 [Neoehrlichia mikurensis]QXK92724.1 hypothetical protein HUN61_01790 [Neoehrlichia mikurensis]QXK93963.1 hypothetical protein HL033_01800 [Neoehrlichia mikurensis]UTO55872.1 hypothetical protein LUA82_02315 [Neoehrlichia mikurensis]UTO56788.1 hypothetical protein LUA81_02295 [Neoehrlichia mikurensis]
MYSKPSHTLNKIEPQSNQFLDQDIENIIKCIESEYGDVIDSSMRNLMKSEIQKAIPELNQMLLPLINIASQEKKLPENLQEDLTKKFMKIMLPHIQKIISAS